MHARQELGDRRHGAENAHSGRQHCTWRRDSCLGAETRALASSRKLSLSRAVQPPEYATVDAASAASTAVLRLAALVRRCRASRVRLFDVSLSADEVHVSFGPSPLETLALVQDCAVVRCFTTTYQSSSCFTKNCDSSQRRKNQNSHRFTVTNPVINIRKKNDRSLGGAGRFEEGRECARLQRERERERELLLKRETKTATRRTALARPA